MAYSLVGRSDKGPLTIAMDATGDADTICQIALEICEEYKLIPGLVKQVIQSTDVPDAGVNEEGEIMVDLLPEVPSVTFPHKRVSLGMYKVF